MKTKHLVHVMHKCETIEDAKDGRVGALAVGKTFRFPSGSAYTVQANGAVVNAKPKTWRSKAERKAIKRAIVKRRQHNES